MTRRRTVVRLFLIIALLKFKREIVDRNSHLGPDDSFSIQEVLDHLHGVADLSSSLLGHRKDSAANLAWLQTVEWGDAWPSAVAFLFMTCHFVRSLRQTENTEAYD